MLRPQIEGFPSATKDRFNDAHSHIECAKSHAVNGAYNMGLAMVLQARVWYKQCRLKEVKSEALHAIRVFKKLGGMGTIKMWIQVLQYILETERLDSLVASGQLGFNIEYSIVSPCEY